MTGTTDQTGPIGGSSRDGRGVPGGLRQVAEEYLATRRALGFTLSTQGRLLMEFVAYCDRHAVATVTTDVALAWATSATRGRDRLWWARRSGPGRSACGGGPATPRR
jgi:hypothetical protein